MHEAIHTDASFACNSSCSFILWVDHAHCGKNGDAWKVAIFSNGGNYRVPAVGKSPTPFDGMQRPRDDPRRSTSSFSAIDRALGDSSMAMPWPATNHGWYR